MTDKEYVYIVYGFMRAELVPIVQYIHELAEKYPECPGNRYKATGRLVGRKDPFPGSTAYMSADGIRALAAEVKYYHRNACLGLRYASHVFMLTPDGRIV